MINRRHRYDSGSEGDQEVRNQKHAERIISDFETAVAWDKKLAKIFRGFKKERTTK